MYEKKIEPLKFTANGHERTRILHNVIITNEIST